MSKNPTSFVGEHSCEYAVVDVVREAAALKNYTAVPFFYWKTREGGRLSRAVHGGFKGRLLAVFPRRPKFDLKNSEIIYWTINYQLPVYAEEARKFGIVTFAAMPVARSLMDLAQSPDVLWISLNDNPLSILQINRGVLTPPNAAMTSSQFIDRALNESRLITWGDAEEAMNSLRDVAGFGGYFGYAPYKPLYFLLVESS